MNKTKQTASQTNRKITTTTSSCKAAARLAVGEEAATTARTPVPRVLAVLTAHPRPAPAPRRGSGDREGARALRAPRFLL